MKLSVLPAHNVAGSISRTLAGLADALEGPKVDYELLLVDNASTDGTLARQPPTTRASARTREV